MLGIAAMSLNIIQTGTQRAMIPDGCDVVQRRAITYDSPPMVRDHRNSPIVSLWRRKGRCDRGFKG